MIKLRQASTLTVSGNWRLIRNTNMKPNVMVFIILMNRGRKPCEKEVDFLKPPASVIGTNLKQAPILCRP